MSKNIKTTEAFYHNLGKLFYAIAFADGTVHEKEFKKLQQYINDYWEDYDDLEDVFDGEAAFLIEIVFEGVQTFEETTADMYEAFVEYKREQPHLFTDEANDLIMKTAHAVAGAFSGYNKSELVILTNLKMELGIS